MVSPVTTIPTVQKRRKKNGWKKADLYCSSDLVGTMLQVCVHCSLIPDIFSSCTRISAPLSVSLSLPD